jgi:hypothetical protein
MGEWSLATGIIRDDRFGCFRNPFRYYPSTNYAFDGTGTRKSGKMIILANAADEIQVCL